MMDDINSVDIRKLTAEEKKAVARYIEGQMWFAGIIMAEMVELSNAMIEQTQADELSVNVRSAISVAIQNCSKGVA